MRSIMQSIQPKWCELIASGKKTIEVRKTRPKTPPPFKVYMYCTKAKNNYEVLWTSMDDLGVISRQSNGKVIGEYICDSLIQIGYNQNGYGLDDSAINGVLAKSCMSEKELYRYLKGAKPNLYHISELVIYDKPKELGEFYTYCAGKGNETDKLCLNCSHLCFDNDLINRYSRWCDVYGRKPLTRAPQDWFYVEKLR